MRTSRKKVALVAALAIAVPLLIVAQTPPKEISVIIDSGPGSLPISDFDGVEMVPVRALASFVGATVRPGSERGVITLSSNGTIARVSDGRNFVPVGAGGLVLLQSPARLIGEEWFVPLDFITKVLPALTSEGVTFRERERLLVLGSSFPQVDIRARHDPNFTQVAIETDRPVTMTHTVDEDAVRVRIATPFLRTSFREENIDDDVVERITLDRDELGYVVTVHLGERFGELKVGSARHPDDALVLDLIRSRVPTRSTPAGSGVDEVPWNLSEQEIAEEDEETDPDMHEEEGSAEEYVDGEIGNPSAEEIFLPEDSHHLPNLSRSGGMDGRSGPTQLRIVTLDPGHGGSATGAEGHGGAAEKQVVLSIARRFRDLLQERLGVRVILTRDSDRDLSHDERAAIANSNKADLFISIHADASPRRNARGSSVYFLSHTSTPTNPGPSSSGDLDFILWSMAQTSHLSESSRLAEILQEELQAITGADQVNRGIKQNSFRVLKGATMPAVLVEVGFISNPEEEKLLLTADYQDKLAEALFRGIVRYRDLFEYPTSSESVQRSER